MTEVKRYRVEPTDCGFWPFCVKAGDGSRKLFTGHKTACERVAAELETAFLDGEYVATQALQLRLDAAEAEVARQKQTIAGMNDAHWRVVQQLAERNALLREFCEYLPFPEQRKCIDTLLSDAKP